MCFQVRAGGACGYLYTVEGPALLLVQQGVVVGQLHQLVQLFFWIFLFQLLQDTYHLEQRRRDTLMNTSPTQTDVQPAA